MLAAGHVKYDCTILKGDVKEECCKANWKANIRNEKVMENIDELS